MIQNETSCVGAATGLIVVGHGRPRTIPYHYIQLLSRCTWHHCSLWRNRSGDHILRLLTVAMQVLYWCRVEIGS